MSIDILYDVKDLKFGVAWRQLLELIPKGSEPRLVSFEEDGLSWECSVKLPALDSHRMGVYSSAFHPINPEAKPGLPVPDGDYVVAVENMVNFFKEYEG